MLAEPKAGRVLPSKIRQTLPACRRIRQRSEFEQVLSAERRINKWFVIHAWEKENGSSRLGIIVSKKNIPNAVTRNYVKRLIRDIFRRLFPAGCVTDVVVRAKRQIKPENSKEARLALAQLFLAVRA